MAQCVWCGSRVEEEEEGGGRWQDKRCSPAIKACQGIIANVTHREQHRVQMLLHTHLSAQQVLRASNVTNSLLRFLGKLLTSTANARLPGAHTQKTPPWPHTLTCRPRPWPCCAG
jgi:hypothetical protein